MKKVEFQKEAVYKYKSVQRVQIIKSLGIMRMAMNKGKVGKMAHTIDKF